MLVGATAAEFGCPVPPDPACRGGKRREGQENLPDMDFVLDLGMDTRELQELLTESELSTDIPCVR